MMNEPANLVIETSRLILRPFTMSDVDSAYEMNLDEHVSAYTGDGGVVSLDETRRRIMEDVLGDYQKHGFGRLAAEIKGKSTFIGFAGLKYLEDLDEVDLGYRFMTRYWGQGIATEAGEACIDFGFNTLGLQRIVAMVFPQNIGSVRVLEKLGFVHEKDIIEDGKSARLYSIVN